jgi:DNA-binding NarL/FixJ family response regulator
MKVLVADSSPLLSQRLAQLISQMNGVEVVEQANDMATAMDAISKLRPHLVMLDVHLLGRRGLDLIKVVKTEAEAPFVMMLADDVSSAYEKECAGAGADFLLCKAEALGQALAIIQSLLKRSLPSPPGECEGD